MNKTLPENVCELHLAHTHNGQCTLSNFSGAESRFEHLGGEAK